MFVYQLSGCTTHGLPQTCATHNASCFASDEFAAFIKHNNICHITSASYQPATNGCVQGSVRTFKNSIKIKVSQIDVAVDQFLFNYRITEHTISGLSPVKLLINRNILYMKAPEFVLRDKVWFTNYNKDDKWIEGVILGKTRPLL